MAALEAIFAAQDLQQALEQRLGWSAWTSLMRRHLVRIGNAEPRQNFHFQRLHDFGVAARFMIVAARCSTPCTTRWLA